MEASKFFTPSSYDRYLYCAEMANKLIDYQNKGFVVMDRDGIVTGKFNLRTNFDYDCWDVFSEETTTQNQSGEIIKTGCVIIDIEYWDVSGNPWIMSKKDMFDIFTRYRVVEPKDIKKVI